MSTRASIVVREKNIDRKNNLKSSTRVFLYHHSDGYPSFLGALLSNYVKENFQEGKTFPDVESIANELVKQGIPYKDNEKTRIDDSFRCAYDLHGDIEYIYIIDTPSSVFDKNENGEWGWQWLDQRTILTCRRRYPGTQMPDVITDEELDSDKFPLVFTTEDKDFELTDEYFEKQDSKF